MKEIIIDATRDNLSEVFVFLQDILSEYNVSKKLARKIKLCVEEMYMNIVNCAYTSDRGKVHILFNTLGVENGEMPLRAIITFVDNGVPCDPLSKSDLDMESELDDFQIGGLGIFIVKETMDDVGYEYKDGQNIFRMEKVIDLYTKD